METFGAIGKRGRSLRDGLARQGAGDLAGRQPFGPEILELLDSIVCPIQQLGHKTAPSWRLPQDIVSLILHCTRLGR
jgi:hypothetical protein